MCSGRGAPAEHTKVAPPPRETPVFITSDGNVRSYHSSLAYKRQTPADLRPMVKLGPPGNESDAENLPRVAPARDPPLSSRIVAAGPALCPAGRYSRGPGRRAAWAGGLGTTQPVGAPAEHTRVAPPPCEPPVFITSDGNVRSYHSSLAYKRQTTADPRPMVKQGLKSGGGRLL